MPIRTRQTLALTAFGALAGPGFAHAATPPDLAIENARVFDAIDGTTHPATVLVHGDRIAGAGTAIVVPASARIIDARGLTLTPGLFDLHTHWTPAGKPATVPAIATAYIQSGVTTVNDFNEAPEAYAPLRQWLALLVTPHVRFAARIGTPEGHGADWADQQTTRYVLTAEDGKAAIASVLPYHPDMIKVFSDGWRYGLMPDNTSMNEDALAAIVTAAHQAGLKVFTHTVTVDRGLIAARAHVDALAHVLQDRTLTPEEIATIRQSGMGEVATLAVYDPDKEGPLHTSSPQTTALRQRDFANALANVRHLHNAGVTVGVGTDAGMPGTPHGASTLHEMELLVRAGLTPAQALMAGTSASAKLAGIDADRGTIAVGQRADLDLFAGNPADDIGNLHRLRMVILDGRPVWGDGAPPLPDANHAAFLPGKPAPPGIDDFERADGRTSLDTLRTTAPDRGFGRSIEVATVIPREGGGHALSIEAQMSHKPTPYAGIVLPLTRGSVTPVDARRFTGVRFQVRGSACPAHAELDPPHGAPLEAPFVATDTWTAVSLPFAAFHAPLRDAAARLAETGHGPTAGALTAIEIGGGCKPGANFWMQIDDVRFY